MTISELEYKSHFKDFAKRIFFLHPNANVPSLNESEERLLKRYGLPDHGVPFFRFDLSLGYLRDIHIDNSILILGTVRDVSSDEYIYLAQDHTVRVKDAEGNDYFVNSSIKSLMTNIYIYSSWLEDMEKRCQVLVRNFLKEEDVFDIYYMLRLEDKACTDLGSFWKEIIHLDLHFDENYSEVL